MHSKQQSQLAFETWQKICQLESALWDCYCDEFMELILRQDEQSAMLNDDDDPQIKYPF
jgi:hypothetical protein